MTEAVVHRRQRGEILRILYENHRKQRHRMDDWAVFAVLERLHYDVSLNEVRTLLQDLFDREYLRYIEDRNRISGDTALRKIEITAKGRDVVEKTIVDPAVDVD